MRKGDANFVKFVNDTLLEMEKNGEAKKIFEKWFGPASDSRSCGATSRSGGQAGHRVGCR